MGRMAFTNYIIQSIIFGWIFYGYGLDQFGKLGPAVTAIFGIAVYVAQAVASSSWLQSYHFGPLEWLWRTLVTYGRWQPMRRSVKLLAAGSMMGWTPRRRHQCAKVEMLSTT
jgi:uncharacterized protein